MANHDWNWGILGRARICRRGVIGALQNARGSRLLAISSRNLETAQAWAQEFGIERAFGCYEHILAQKDVDAVYIPLPNHLHKAWVMAAADAGKHVLCEKPLACDAAEAEEMVAHCRKRGVLLMEAFMWRHQPRTLALQELVASGRLGELKLVRMSFSFSIDPADWRVHTAKGGGALADIGCYGLNVARFFTGGEPARAQTMARRGPNGVDLSLATQLEFPNGVLCVIDCSFEQPYRCTYELVGTRGAMEVPEGILPPPAPVARLTGLGDDAAAPSAETLSFDGSDQYTAMVSAFCESLAAGRLLPPCEDGLAQMQAMDLVRAAK